MIEKELKLYELSFVKDENSWKESLSYSHSIDKLQLSVPSQEWTVFQPMTHDNGKVRESRINQDSEYPKYLIFEVNFIV